MGRSDDEKMSDALKAEAIGKAPTTDPKALDKIKDRTKHN